MNALIFILILILLAAGILQAYMWGYDKGYHDGYEDGDYEGYSCGIKDSNRQFQNMCDEVIDKGIRQIKKEKENIYHSDNNNIRNYGLREQNDSD